MADRSPGAASPSRALIGFVRAALAFAAWGRDDDEERLLDSPFSGIHRDDARALIVAARDRQRPIDAIVERRIPMPHDAMLAGARFVAALDAVQRTFRAQGATAAEVVAGVALGFELERRATAEETKTLHGLARVAASFDARRNGAAWDMTALLAAIEDVPGAVPQPSSEVGLRPLGPHAPEAPAAVGGRRGHQSASSLGTYAECERKWYYRYVCAAVEDRGSSASAYGSAFHYALEQFHGEFPRGDSAPPEVLRNKLESYVAEAFERYRLGFPTNVEFELQKRRARRTARRYIAWFLERSRAHPFTVVGRETEADVEFDGFRFVGYIDRLDRDDRTGNVTVVDYKTGAIAQTAADYRERIARNVDFQLPFYYWARTLAGDHVTRLALVPLKEASLDVRPVELEVVPVPAGSTDGDAPVGTIGIDELVRARSRMVEVSRVLAEDGIAHFGVTDDPEACRYCAYVNACRARPGRREDKFAR